MSTDNRTIINDCEANTGWSGDDTATPIGDAGQFYQGSNALSTQLSNADEQMSTTQDSVGASTFNLDWSDSTLYLLVKDNLQQTAANGGVQFVIGDGTDLIGYDVGGNDATGLPLPTYFNCYKLDVSVIVATPGSFATYSGSEPNLDQTQITEVGYGTIHLAKAVGSVDNVFMDCFRYIANGSYALTINGGTSGTPETMADVVGDDISNGWGMISNPLGDQYLFFAPTEWGDSGSSDSYFTASNEQWYLLGGNGTGGHQVASGNFPFRLIGGSGTNSFVLSDVVVVSTGTAADLDLSDTNMDTIELTRVTFNALDTISLPTSGGTSRFTQDCSFIGCGQITHNGADSTGSSISGYEGTTDTGALLYNVAADPEGELDDMTFTKGTAATHAIEFGTSSPLTMTLSGITFSGYNASDGQTDSTLYIRRTGGVVTINLSGVTGNVSYKSDGATVNLVATVSVTFTGLPTGTEARAYTTGTTTQVAGEENITDGDFVVSAEASDALDIRILNNSFDHGAGIGYVYFEIINFIVPASNTSIPVSLIPDRNYNNP